MNYQLLFDGLGDRRIRIAVTGAAGGYARSLLAQCRMLANLEVAALVDLDPAAVVEALAELGYDPSAVRLGRTGDEADAGDIVVTDDYTVLDDMALDFVVEATGVPEVSLDIAARALRRGVGVAMVSKETDAVAGPWLARLAAKHDAVYTVADGDQPGNLIGLYTWARLLGLEVVAAGKASEYDIVVDDLTKRDDHGPWSAAPDCCEMNVVANATGLLPGADGLLHPVCRVTELADVFNPDSGILGGAGELAVFRSLRRPDEASVAGGVFVVVRCTSRDVWQTLKGKGHVVSRSGDYAAIYLPYHLMGIETPLSLFSAVLYGSPPAPSRQAFMIARTTRDFRAGELLAMGGHHHEIDGISTQLLPFASGPAPFYLAANKRLQTDVPAGTIITLDMLDLAGSALAAAWRET